MVLVFLSRGYFLSANCLREVRHALAVDKPIVLIHEVDRNKGGATLQELKDECPEDLRAAVFEGRPPAAAGGSAPPLRLDTGFADGAFGWVDADGGALELREAFADVHAWGDASAAAPNHATSRNADRTEWIDYVFHTPATLTPTARSDTAAPDAAMPSETHPSDHLPLAVAFELRTSRV